MTFDSPTVHLSFDVEEFDLPNECGGDLSLEEQLAFGRHGLETVLPWLDSLDIKTTLFTTARFAEHAPDLLRPATSRHEIASHAVRHDTFENGDYLASRSALSTLLDVEVVGFRRPRLQPIDVAACRAAGYQYDSSENPIRLPGRYDNRHLLRTPRMDNGLLRIPISASPRWRIPLFWLSWGNLPMPLLRRALERTLAADGRLVLFFHPWEFIAVPTRIPMPRIVRRRTGPRLLDRVDKELRRLQRMATFEPMRSMLPALSGVE